MIGRGHDLPTIIGNGFDRRRKQFVEVFAEHKTDGAVIPKTVVLSDGQRYDIELYRDPIITEISMDGSQPVVYPIRANGTKTYLFEDCGRWYVMMKT